MTTAVSVLALSAARDYLLLVGAPAIGYGLLLAAGAAAAGRRLGRPRSLAFALPVLLGVGAVALALGLFAAVGGELRDAGDDASDAFVGWGRLILLGLYVLALVASGALARALGARAGLNRTKLTALVVSATFFFVIVSAPFASRLNSCYVGHPILINAELNC